MIGASPRGPDLPGILEILQADSLSSSTVDIHPSQPGVRPHSFQAGDPPVLSIQELARAPGLQVCRWIGVLPIRGHLDLRMPTVGDTTLGSAIGLQAPALFVAVRATL